MAVNNLPTVLLRDSQWRFTYNSEDGDLVQDFYIPALKHSIRYDRSTGYFSAEALTLAARGIEGLVGNSGRMRLLVGCTLDQKEIDAIESGELFREQVKQHMIDIPLDPSDIEAANALELLSWMIAKEHLDVKVAVPCDGDRTPIVSDAIFHEKCGVVEDKVGNKIAWTGSLNETAAGWQRNYESISVFTSWGLEPGRTEDADKNFINLWEGHTKSAIVMDVPEAVRNDLMRFLPNDEPRRYKAWEKQRNKCKRPNRTAPGPDPQLQDEDDLSGINKRSLVWSFIEKAPSIEPSGVRVGEATSAVTPWPHQVRVFERLYEKWPPKLLIADEVGLGKTIQAGMLIRQAWLAQKAKRILILAPKALLNQGQIELREKFNLNWPIYDGEKLRRYPSPALKQSGDMEINRVVWHEEPCVITSSQLMRRRERADVLIQEAEPWDLVILDEAHHARRRGAGSVSQGGPNLLLQLMQQLKERTQGLVLLTATPMQVHPVELWDLLNLLDLSREWDEKSFLWFFNESATENLPLDALERMVELFQDVEREYGAISTDRAQQISGISSSIRIKKVLRAIRDTSNIPRRRLDITEQEAAVKILQGYTPVNRLISRNTREMLREYSKAGVVDTQIATRQVHDTFIEMSAEEQQLYSAVEDYISTTYSQAAADKKAAVGFVMTVYRRRIASCTQSLKLTLEKRLLAKQHQNSQVREIQFDEEDVLDDDLADEIPDTNDISVFEREALVNEERSDIEHLLKRIEECPLDKKLKILKSTLLTLREQGYKQAMVFTQFTDTMEFLRDKLLKEGEHKLMCFSGGGGQIPATDGGWRKINRDQVKDRFLDGEADILLCTDAAAEGLNFQFCGAVINYDMPWNPMRVEQRIGRIDRLGQKHKEIQIINMHYEGTVETDIYRSLRKRIGLFESVVGSLQPILARLPQTISKAVIHKSDGSEKATRQYMDIENQIDLIQDECNNFSIDSVIGEDLVRMPARPEASVTLKDLDRVIGSGDLIPIGTEIQPMNRQEYGLRTPGMNQSIRVTTDPSYYEANSDSVELWSPGNPLFRPPKFLKPNEKYEADTTLNDLLERL